LKKDEPVQLPRTPRLVVYFSRDGNVLRHSLLPPIDLAVTRFSRNPGEKTLLFDNFSLNFQLPLSNLVRFETSFPAVSAL